MLRAACLLRAAHSLTHCRRIPKNTGIEGHVAKTQVMAQVDASSSDSRFEIGDAKNVVCAPIATSHGKVYAVIKFTNKLNSEARHIQFSREDATIIQAIADSAGVALHKARLRSKVTSEQRKNKSLISVMKAVHQSKDNVDLLVKNLVSVAYDIIEVELVNLFIADKSSQSLICTVSKIEEIEGHRYPFGSADRKGSSVAGMVAYTGTTFCLNDVSSDAEVLEEFMEMGVAAKNVLCMPIRDHRKKLVAIFPPRLPHVHPLPVHHLQERPNHILLRNQRSVFRVL